MAKKILTLNIGAATLSLAEYEADAKGALTLVNYGTAALPAPLDGGSAGTILAPALLEIVRSTGIRPGPVSLSVSGQTAFQRFAAIPAAGGAEKFEQMVRYEIEQNVPFPIDEMVCDRQVLGDTEEGDRNVLVVAAKLDQIEPLTEAVASVGFRPELVDVAPLALTNVVCRDFDDGGSSVILDIGAKTTSLVIVEGEKLYNRSIPVAGNAITKEIVAVLGCTQEEAEQVKVEKGYVSLGGVTEDEDEVADRVSKACRAVLTRLNAEISRSINFYRSQQGGTAPARIFLTGGTTLLPQIDTFFAESLGIEVVYLNPFETIAVGPKVDAAALETDGALIAATAGLAAHRAGGVRYAVNLLPPSLVEERAEKARIPVLAAAGLALVAAFVFVWLSVSGDRDVVVAKGEEVAARGEALKGVDAKVAASLKALTEKEAEAASLGRLVESRTAAIRRLWAVCKAIDGRSGAWIEKWNAQGVTIRQWNDASLKSGSGKTVAESIAAAVGANDTNVIDAASVKITAMSEFGKHADIKQFTMEFKNR